MSAEEKEKGGLEEVKRMDVREDIWGQLYECCLPPLISNGLADHVCSILVGWCYSVYSMYGFSSVKARDAYPWVRVGWFF